MNRLPDACPFIIVMHPVLGMGDEELQAQEDTCLKNYSNVIEMSLFMQRVQCPIAKARMMADAVRALNTSVFRYYESLERAAAHPPVVATGTTS